MDTGIVKIHGVNVLGDRDAAWWQWITAHEIGHMYFGYWVRDAEATPSSALGWLTLGLGLYLDRQYVEARGIECRFHDNQVSAYREAQSAGRHVAFGLSDGEMEGLDFDYNTVVLHGRSYCIVDEISRAVGRSGFVSSLRKLLSDYGGKAISYPVFREFIERKTGKSLGVEIPECEL